MSAVSSFERYQVEVGGKIVSEWTSFDQAVGAAVDDGVAKALKRGAMPGFRIFYRTAQMRHGAWVRQLMFSGVAGPGVAKESPAALERPGPDQQRTPL